MSTPRPAVPGPGRLAMPGPGRLAMPGPGRLAMPGPGGPTVTGSPQAPEPQAPEPQAPEPQAPGAHAPLHPGVAAALGRLEELDGAPVAAHVEVLDGVHRLLQDALATLDEV